MSKQAFSGVVVAILLAVTALGGGACEQTVSSSPTPSPSPTTMITPPGSSQDTLTPVPTAEPPLSAPLALRLVIPWSLDFLPDGSIMFTERPGRVRLIDARDGLIGEPLLTIADVAPVGEGGLLGITVHPGFAGNGLVYLYYTYRSADRLANRVVRFRLQGRNLVERAAIIEGIPGSSNHNGGRIKFGPDGMLYITTGDAQDTSQAQDKGSLAGKILRLNDDGTIPDTNPFPGSPVYSYGHRNPQGLAWDDQGRLWETEHGSSATDELNLIRPGGNYGWPVIRGDQEAEGMESPVLQSGRDTWAPSGIAFFQGSLYFAGLRGQTLFQVKLDEQPPVLLRHFSNTLGRLRDVLVGPDNLFYILTNNRDGRGAPRADDDQIIRVNPGKL